MLSQLLVGGALAASLPHAVLGNTFSLQLQKLNVPGTTTLPGNCRPGTASIGEIDQQGFWFTNFTVGDTADLLILIDTGSTDVYLNPGFYKPSPGAQDLDVNFTITFETTNPNGSGTETITGPVYKDVVALDNTQLTLPAQILGVVADPVSPPSFPNDGLIGFAGPYQSALNSTSWFQQLCDHDLLAECRFGIAFKTDNTGVQYFGEVATDRFHGSLSVAPVVPNTEWGSWVDIAYDGKVIEEDAMMISDSGTTIIFGPLDSVQTLFDAAGVQSVLTPSSAPGAPSILTGYFACDNPPTIGFGFPSTGNATAAAKNASSPVSHQSKVFNILPSQLVSNQTGNNCTASVVGTNEFPFWLIGQVFFQGKYIDHNHDDETMGFALLAN